MARIFALFVAVSALAGLSPWLLPLAKEGARLVAARDDPAAIADLALADVSAADLARRMDAALAEGDASLATSFLALADARGLAVPAELRARITAATSGTAAALRAAGQFGRGFVSGVPEDMPGLAGAAMGDLMVWGDIRDASREGWKLATGDDPDELLLGLSVAGLAITAGTYATVGGGLPVRAGVSLVKLAKRTGHLSASLGRAFGRAVREAVDLPALRRLGAGSLDAAAVKGVVRPEGLKALSRMLGDLGTVQGKAGTRAAAETLRVAESGADLRRAAALASVKGEQTLGILRLLGRGALVITGKLITIVWWLFATAAYIVGLVAAFNSFCVSCVRPLWRRKGRGTHRGTARRPCETTPGLPPAAPDLARAEARFADAVRAAVALRSEGAGLAGERRA